MIRLNTRIKIGVSLDHPLHVDSLWRHRVSLAKREFTRCGISQLWILFVFLLFCTVSAAEQELRLVRYNGVEYVADHQVSETNLKRFTDHLIDVSERLHSMLDIDDVSTMPRIYLFADRDRMAAYVSKHVPQLRKGEVSSRDGLFLLRRGHCYLFVYAGPKCTESIRHEAVHSILNQHFPGLPLWLDEGLAQCFEQENGTFENVNAIQRLEQHPKWRALPTRSQLSRKSRMQDFTELDYAASWKITVGLLESGQVRDTIYKSQLPGGWRRKVEFSRIIGIDSPQKNKNADSD